ncbi:DNA sulfur modification protein DndB [Spirosoma sp. SC4-14]|uniref:DNA sulfur modification protein DndB n=1 Tax=Spirosoma sp. SC4-14 TaxID=3128900 RepID=UPI0030CFAEDC
MPHVEIYLPALTGQFGQWRYYQISITVADVVKNFGTINAPNFRIKTVEEVNEIYSEKGVSKLLQRAYEKKRLIPIKKYLLMQPDKYINNLTVAIFGGSPDWLPLNISHTATGFPLSEHDEEFLGDTFGVIKLTGAETLFVLDGQHRLKGLRAAYEEDSSIGEEIISVTLIVHEDSSEGRERTRRLFSTVNRHAKPVSLGENILLDEDDVSAIITRKLIEDYPLLRDREAVALNKTANLYANQYEDKFTSVIALYHINELLLDNQAIYNSVYGDLGEDYDKIKIRVRPDNQIIEGATETVYAFWNTFFGLFPEAVRFIEGDRNIGRERDNGGPFYLRPVGQEVIAMLYVQLQNEPNIFARISNIPASITDPFWLFVMWDGTNVIQAKSHIRDYLFYQFGYLNDPKKISTLKRNYRKYANDETVELPMAQFSSTSTSVS